MAEEKMEVVVSSPPIVLSTMSTIQLSVPSPAGVINSLQPSPPESKSPWTPRFNATPVLASPIAQAIVNVRSYLEEVGHLTRLDPQDEWLPITESRNGNAAYSAFHTVSAGIGAQALLLPVAFAVLGWVAGILCFCIAFSWQLYTFWLLTQLHESVEKNPLNLASGTRYSRYMHLATATFGNKLAKFLVKFPCMYLSAGTCTALIVIGGGSMKLFYEIVCGPHCKYSKPIITIEWYLIFACLAIILAQLPNLNSLAGVSLMSAISAIGYCTLVWVISLSKGQVSGVSYELPKRKSQVAQVFNVLNAVGIVAFAFRGHNLTLEIQATMPSTPKNPSHKPMWKGIKIAYFLISICLFPIAIAGYWVYGNSIPSNGILTALYKVHGHDTSQAILGLTSLLVVINCLSSYQLYAMVVIDNWESAYTSKKNRPCPIWLRTIIRSLFCTVTFYVAVAFPFLPSLAGLIGGISLPVTLSYPCFMWILVKKPERWSRHWCINWLLGCLGMVLSCSLATAGVWSIIDSRLKFQFFKAR